ncbi:MAG: hypothetical protein J0L93_09150 [Deltaproteobacteria bacterium]|nr:hypothetical protein [Deltaproteobacteria bacterium]
MWSFLFSLVVLSANPDPGWFSARESDIEDAKCLPARVPEATELWTEIATNFSVDELEATFNDLHTEFPVQLKGEQRKKEIYVQLLQDYLGNEGVLLAFIHIEFGFNAVQFSRIEQESLYLAFSAMPKGFHSPKKNMKLKRVEMIDQGVLANATLSFSNLWLMQNGAKRIYTVIHELAHLFDFDASDSENWRNISGFPRIISKNPQLKESTLVSKYAARNQWEDFAESVSAYRLNPWRLLLASQEKYDWIRWQVFGGKQYLRMADCDVESIFSEVSDELRDEKIRELVPYPYIAGALKVAKMFY